MIEQQYKTSEQHRAYHREYQRKWYWQHREKLLGQMKDYYLRNKGRIHQYTKEWLNAHRHPCPTCGKLIAYSSTYCTRHWKRPIGAKHCMWKGGRYVDQYGYIVVRVMPQSPFYSMAGKNHFLPEHRLKMAEHLGRPLEKEEIVHHLNGIKGDNRVSNLAIVSRHNHPSLTFMKSLQGRIQELESLLGDIQ